MRSRESEERKDKAECTARFSEEEGLDRIIPLGEGLFISEAIKGKD